MPVDILMTLENNFTATATRQSTGFDLGIGGSVVGTGGAGTAGRGLVMRVNFSAASNATGANAFTFTVEHSADNATWFTLASGAKDAVNLSTTVQTGEIWVPFETRLRYIRAVATLSGAGTVPTITYTAALAPSFP